MGSIPMGVAMDSVRVDSLDIAFLRGGQGPVLLLLHGAVCDSRVWRSTLDALGDDFTVVAWDAPGCGESSDAPPQFRMTDFARCLGAFIEALGVERVDLLGHSWGSALALQLCVQRPALVDRLVIVAGYAGWAGSLPPDEVERRLAFALSVADAIDSGRWDPKTMPGLFSGAMPAERADELTAIMSEIRGSATRTMARALADVDLRGALGAIESPTLLVCGDADERSPLTVSYALEQAIPKATLAVLPGVGHECFLEATDAFAQVVRSFLSPPGTATGTEPAF